MKTLIKTLFIAALAIAMVSCGKDDDNGNPADKLIGTWELTSEEYRNCDDPSDNEVENYPYCENISGIEVCNHIQFTFDKDESLTFKALIVTQGAEAVDEEDVLTYSLNGSNMIICDGAECTKTIYSISGNILTITIEKTDEDDCETIFKYKKL